MFFIRVDEAIEGNEELVIAEQILLVKANYTQYEIRNILRE